MIWAVLVEQWKFDIKWLGSRYHHKNIRGPLDSRMRTRISTRLNCPFLAKILRKFITCMILLLVGSIPRLFRNSYNLLIEKCQNCYRVLGLFWHDNIFANLGLHALNVVLWENLVLVVVLDLESKTLYYKADILSFCFCWLMSKTSLL